MSNADPRVLNTGGRSAFDAAPSASESAQILEEDRAFRAGLEAERPAIATFAPTNSRFGCPVPDHINFSIHQPQVLTPYPDADYFSTQDDASLSNPNGDRSKKIVPQPVVAIATL